MERTATGAAATSTALIPCNCRFIVCRKNYTVSCVGYEPAYLFRREMEKGLNKSEDHSKEQKSNSHPDWGQPRRYSPYAYLCVKALDWDRTTIAVAPN